jgi:hypothetical protein
VKRQLAVSLVAAVAIAGLLSQASGAAGAGSSGPTLHWASDLKPTHGGGSRAPYGYLPLHARDFGRAKAAANARAGLEGARAAAPAATGGPVVTAFPNVSPSFDGVYQTGLTPPDTTGAIGPDRYIETLNTEYAIYSRSGSLLNSGSLSSLTGIPTGVFGYALSDPQVMWDAKTQRFYYSAVYYDSLLLSDNGLAVGWSKTATPSSASDFCQYSIGFGTELPDYPKLGDSKDFLLYGYNLFGLFGASYDGSSFAVLNKPPAGSSCADPSGFTVTDSGVLHNQNGSMAATPVPANLVDDGTGTGYVVANADLSTVQSANFVSVYSVTTAGTDANGIPVPQIGGPTNVTVPNYSLPANAPQAGSQYLLDTLDGRFEAAVAAVDPGHGGKLAIWTAHSVYGGPGAEERWYEIDPGAGSLLQSGQVGDTALFAWNGAVSPDRANDGSSGSHGESMAMSVSTSSASSYPAIEFVWKNGSSAQSALSNLVQSSGPNIDFSCSSTAACRWGDYSGASPDPAAGGGGTGTVWLGNQYNITGGTTSTTAWRTWLFAVAPTSGAASASLSFVGPQTVSAGSASSAMHVAVSQAQPSSVLVTLSTSSSDGGFATDPSATTWSNPYTMTIDANSTTSPDFYYRDTKAGTPTLTASAAGLTSGSQIETVNAAALATIAVSPSSATVSTGGTQVFTATGADAYGNPVDVSSADWATDAPGTVSPSSGSSTTFSAGSATGGGSVTATILPVSGSATVNVAAATAPDPPTNLSARARGKRITLSWTGSGSGVTYDIYRGTSPGAEALYSTGVAGTSFNDTNLVSRTTYWYYVTAVGPGGESGPSNEASATAR